MTPLSDSEAATVARFEAAQPAPESWGGGLREAIKTRLRDMVERYESSEWSVWDWRDEADAFLALPEVAALRAKAAAADRVRELLPRIDEAADWDAERGRYEAAEVGRQIREHIYTALAALDGPPC